MFIQGSPEWFHENANKPKYEKDRERVEGMRASFISRFSPQRLKGMNGSELLANVFGSEDDCMVRILMFDGDYRWFGAPGKYVYLGIVYQKQGGIWCYKEGPNAEEITRAEAEKKAEHVRNLLISCIDEIDSISKESGFELIGNYEELANRISKYFLSSFAWVIKYFQMIYPEYFAAMYADHTIERAQEILGLPNHGKTKRIINIGEISLFIRRCDVNNIIFNEVYADEWGWEEDYSICENAEKNYENRLKPVRNVNVDYYETPRAVSERLERTADVQGYIEDSSDIDELAGEERNAIVKLRVNQSIFRDNLIKRYGKCCLCGVNCKELLLASHIKPWADSDEKEKLDVDNGLLLCPAHDRLFDKGFITFTDDGFIEISEELDEMNRTFLNVHEGMRINLTEDNSKYLSYHRTNIYRQ